MTLRKVALGLVVSAVCLYFVLRNVQWSEVWTHLTRVNPLLFALSMLLMLVAYFLMTWRWQHLLDPLDIPGAQGRGQESGIRGQSQGTATQDSKLKTMPLSEVNGQNLQPGIRHHASLTRLYGMTM